MQIAGRPGTPISKSIGTYGGVGRLTASAHGSSGSGAASPLARDCRSRRNMKGWYSSQVTSHSPIQNGETSTRTRGPSQASRPDSPSGLPSSNAPPGTGTMRNFAAVLGMGSTYARISAAVAASAPSTGRGFGRPPGESG